MSFYLLKSCEIIIDKQHKIPDNTTLTDEEPFKPKSDSNDLPLTISSPRNHEIKQTPASSSNGLGKVGSPKKSLNKLSFNLFCFIEALLKPTYHPLGICVLSTRPLLFILVLGNRFHCHVYL